MLGVVVALVAGGCAEGIREGRQSWRGLEVVLPEGWQVFEDTSTVFGVANAPLGNTPAPEGDVVAAQFTYEPGARIDDWRALVTDQGGTIESDQELALDGIPARSITYRYVTNGVPTRERVVVVSARQIVILLQPVPLRGEQDAPEVFEAYTDDFEALLDSIEWGAPVEGASGRTMWRWADGTGLLADRR